MERGVYQAQVVASAAGRYALRLTFRYLAGPRDGERFESRYVIASDWCNLAITRLLAYNATARADFESLLRDAYQMTDKGWFVDRQRAALGEALLGRAALVEVTEQGVMPLRLTSEALGTVLVSVAGGKVEGYPLPPDDTYDSRPADYFGDPMWSYPAYLDTSRWAAKRRACLYPAVTYNGRITFANETVRCAERGCMLRAAEAHHLTYERLFDERPEDLQPLCADHHRQAHADL